MEEKPYIRDYKTRFNIKNEDKESNFEDGKKQEKNTFYRIRRSRGNVQNDKEIAKVSRKKVEIQENNEVILPKRYHRRYRETKSSKIMKIKFKINY